MTYVSGWKVTLLLKQVQEDRIEHEHWGKKRKEDIKRAGKRSIESRENTWSKWIESVKKLREDVKERREDEQQTNGRMEKSFLSSLVLFPWLPFRQIRFKSDISPVGLSTCSPNLIIVCSIPKALNVFL